MPYLPQIFLMLSQRPCVIGYDNVTLIFYFIGGRLGTCGAPINDLSGRPIESFLHLVQSPFGIFAFSESLPEMVLFLLEQLRLATHCRGTMGDGVDYTKFDWDVMVTVPTVSTGQYEWVFCTQWWTVCHQPLVWQWCPRRGWTHPPCCPPL